MNTVCEHCGGCGCRKYFHKMSISELNEHATLLNRLCHAVGGLGGFSAENMQNLLNFEQKMLDKYL